MKSYKVYVQGKFYKVFFSEDFRSVLSKVALDIKQKLVPDFNPDEPQNINIVPESSS
jgi:hypothetical protein